MQVLCHDVELLRYHKTVVPWRIHGVSPPDVTFRGFYYHEASRFIEGGIPLGGAVGAALSLNTIMVMSARPHAILGKYLMRN